ncbi:MAG: hypothetical protein JXD23_00030 [Spirochaetales bacterium]|nr:hypothetical protein [Spirochaetales bacterium]
MAFNLLLQSPYPWIFAASLFAGAALSALTRRTTNKKDPERARERKGFSAALAVALCVIFVLCAVFIPGAERLKDAKVLLFALIVTAVFFIAFRFRKAAGLPLLLLAGAAAVALVLFFRAVTAFTGETEIARLDVGEVKNGSMKFDFILPGRKAEALDMPGTLLGAEVKEIVFHDVFVFFGAKTAYRFVGLKSAEVKPGSEMTQEMRAYELKRPPGISEALYRFVEDNPWVLPGTKTVQRQITYVKAKPDTDYSVRIQNDGGVQITAAGPGAE